MSADFQPGMEPPGNRPLFDYIVSRNLRDFQNSRIKAISPKEYITEYEILLGNENK